MAGLWQDRYQPSSLAESFARGIQIRNANLAAEHQRLATDGQRFQLEELYAQRDRTNAFREAIKANDPAAAQAADPFAYAKMQEQQIEIRKKGQDSAKLRAEETQRMQEAAARAIGANPRLAGAYQNEVMRRAQRGEIDPFEVVGADTAHTVLPEGMVGPEALPSRGESRAAVQTAGGDPFKGMDNGLKEYLGSRPNDDPSIPGFAERYDAWNRANKKSGAVSVNVGGMAGASKKTTADQEAAMLKANDTASMLDEIDRIATGPDGKRNFSQFLGFAPRGKRFALDMAASIDSNLVPQEQRAWFDKMNQFRAAVGEYKSTEYHNLLGGSQTASEIRNLVNVVLSEDMSGPAFEAAYTQLRRKTERAQQVASMVLGEGIPVTDPRYRKRFAELERSRFGGSSTAPKVPEVEIQPGTEELFNTTGAP
jgi:hypothetical protein